MANLNNVGASALDPNGRSITDRLAPSGLRVAAPRVDAPVVGGQTPGAGRSVVGDSVRLSPEALKASQPGSIDDLPGDRAAVVRSVRALIGEDAYLTDEKLSVALDRLIDDALGLPRG